MGEAKRKARQDPKVAEVVRAATRAEVQDAADAMNARGMPVLILSGMDQGDETYSSERGMWNVSAMRRAVAGGGVGNLGRISVHELLRANARTEVQQHRVRELLQRPASLHYPLLCVLEDKAIWLVDGQHRLRALAAIGQEEALVWLLDEAEGARFRVTIQRQDPDGTLHAVTPQELGLLGAGRTG